VRSFLSNAWEGPEGAGRQRGSGQDEDNVQQDAAAVFGSVMHLYRHCRARSQSPHKLTALTRAGGHVTGGDSEDGQVMQDSEADAAEQGGEGKGGDSSGARGRQRQGEGAAKCAEYMAEAQSCMAAGDAPSLPLCQLPILSLALDCPYDWPSIVPLARLARLLP